MASLDDEVVDSMDDVAELEAESVGELPKSFLNGDSADEEGEGVGCSQ